MTSSTSQPVYGKSYGGKAPENYERYFVPVIGAPLAADLVAEAALRPGERVLDVACGTGVVTRLAAQRVGRTGTVAALDINPAMLAVARAMSPPDGAAIRWYEASAESIPLPDDSFDVVTCQMGLQFMAEKSTALREMRRVLAPGGRDSTRSPSAAGTSDSSCRRRRNSSGSTSGARRSSAWRPNGTTRGAPRWSTMSSRRGSGGCAGMGWRTSRE